MTARRLDRTPAILGIAVALTIGGQAQAQLAGGQWRLNPQANTGRIAVEVKQQPTVVFVQPGMNSTVFSRQPVATSYGPAILMSDGTVYANFSGVYSPVVSTCGGAVVVGQAQVIGSNGVVLYQPALPPTYTQPVPAQMTSSQQMLPSVQARNGTQMQMSQAAQLACYNRGASRRATGHRH